VTSRKYLRYDLDLQEANVAQVRLDVRRVGVSTLGWLTFVWCCSGVLCGSVTSEAHLASGVLTTSIVAELWSTVVQCRYYYVYVVHFGGQPELWVLLPNSMAARLNVGDVVSVVVAGPM
jgi:hypothetical protein